ncbi:alpha-L-rhamnosidase [Auriculariales sp. MPI-PUGE-AT-0066]|nr:alpha-L-rhamnosidase [Auriculariales sp. MPI-PUGE-AT-0066]
MVSLIATVLLIIAIQHSLAAVLDSDSEPWHSFILAPRNRNPIPDAVSRHSGHVAFNGLDVMLSRASQVTFDFGREVAGHIRFTIESPMRTPIHLAYTESPIFIGNRSDDTGASPLSDWDQTLEVSLPDSALNSSHLWTTSPEHFRGGFRYLTITASQNLEEEGIVKISNLACILGFHPGVENPRLAYRGYFYTPDDEVLVRAWYAGAYTVQTNIAPPNTGRFLPQVRPGWAYNASLGVDGPILLDGAKRDRAVWPGVRSLKARRGHLADMFTEFAISQDLGVSAPSSFLAFGPKFGYDCVLNALETLFFFQNATTGMFPFAGPDTNSFRSGSKSDTYHSWSMVAIAEYALFSGNETWLDWHWRNMTRAVEYIIENIGDDGLQIQNWPNDWARQGGGGTNSALNAITYGALKRFSNLAATRDSGLAKLWDEKAELLKAAFHNILWDAPSGLYRDNASTPLHPQDGNSLAVYFNLTTSLQQRKAISQSLLQNWNAIGPVTPELPDTISPFVSSWEVEAHFLADEPDRALDLVRRLWGYLLDGPGMGGSTLAEGISANGSLYYRSQAGYNYDPAYTSLAHSWSTGPTTSLLTRLLGLRITSGKGATWDLCPPFGVRLNRVRGGFESPLGTFDPNHRKLEGVQIF